MDLITRTELEQLAASTAGPHVSLYLPTHRAGRETEGDPLRLKNQLTAVEAALIEDGHTRAGARELLAPAWTLLDDTVAWQHMADGLALFLTADGMRSYRLSLQLPDLAAVGDRFVLSPLLPLLNDERFLALTVSQKQVRVLEGDRSTVARLDLQGVPESFYDVYEDDEIARADKAPRPAPSGSSGGGGAVFYGSGVFDNVHQKEVLEFFRAVADGVHQALADRHQPMVLLGLTEQLAAYRSVNRYPHLLEQAVERNPDDLTAESAHDAVWPIIEERLAERVRAAIERFGQQRSNGTARETASEALSAAQEGRVDTLLLDTDGCWAAGNEGEVLRLGGETPHLCERLDETAIAVLTTGGQVLVCDELPERLRVAAVLRY